MKKYTILLLLLLISTTSHAYDKKLGTTNCFKVGIFDTIGNGISGLDVVTPFAHTVTKIQCGGNSATTMDETSDTMADEGSGYYYICTNDSITNNPEEECLGWVEGEGTMLNLIAKTPVKFKSVGATVDMGIGTFSGAVFSSGDCTNSQTVFDTDLTQTQTDHWEDTFLTFTSGILAGQTKPVTAFNGTTKCISIRDPGFSTTPTAGDAFVIINK